MDRWNSDSLQYLLDCYSLEGEKIQSYSDVSVSLISFCVHSKFPNTADSARIFVA